MKNRSTNIISSYIKKSIAVLIMILSTSTITSCSFYEFYHGAKINKTNKIMKETQVFFDSCSYIIPDEYITEIENFVFPILDKHSLKIKIIGNTDQNGGVEYNLALGQRRAYAVYKILKVLGISDDQIEVISLGKTNSILDHSNNEEYLSKNRRVDIICYK
ncbi:OmpA family protein [Candidatus Kinetoplastidibacterium crithidiae]|uniref:Peptidoglycan-associated lipoprotein n=1 Tax=Candidatus Kinetoplastidibacterium crithidiae TCC036E TaxID=1208918 RepID=M1LXD8_9PROT|nr:OmpA family protein [Candidatus Kinetoplastibacterium crithidii]AFZ82866.1 peptidoglycan-associated lipoprotein [Candidatus Kinetoplastibacterium crithidii (ex Angomonas deanei ATCC 30255)]AGF47869.1 peptidoglycan-associated lipoprotein [Candidatus Kinetoplastibacterium crithidii TCC036E]